MLRLRLLATTASTLLVAAVLTAPIAAAQTAPPPATADRPLTPEWGDIDAFWGDIDAFWGDIDAFEGDVNPFWGDIDAFWGDIDAFWGDIDAFSGSLSPKWGDIDAFWGDIDAFAGGVAPLWGDIDAFWGNIDALGPKDPARLHLQTDFKDLVTRSGNFWGAAVKAKTGKSFWDGFAAGVFAKHGIDINNPATFNGFSGVDRTRFFFDWYDGLMEFSGRDHADWWMKTANWTPTLTNTVGGGTGTTIGLIDFTFNGADLIDNTSTWAWKGYDNPMQGHGEAVASLLVSAHDGRGLMGIAPNAKVATFNPFDSTGTASWDAVVMGVSNVNFQGARVVNLSLGVPGYALHPDWNAFYSNFLVAMLSKQTVFVHAAGNDGIAQTGNMAWNFATDPAMLVVGSVGPSGQISAFSNTPGTACLLDNGKCLEQNKLKNRFLVAPGEWILVSDGQGGVTRRSGTSFAAPQVTGAIALLQGRWSWLKAKPRETASIILGSARDLGAPGVDPVYGHGLLDITASQSPLDYAKLYQKTTDSLGVVTKTTIKLVNPATAGILFSASSSPVTVFEDVGTTYRDFVVPLSSILQPAAKTSKTSTTSLKTVTSTTTTSSRSRYSFGFAGSRVANPFGWDLSLSVAELPVSEQEQRDRLPYASRFSVTSNDGATLTFGDGLGAQALNGRSAVEAGRFDAQTGGVNPVLGLASGGGYANVEVPALGSARLSFGATSRRAEAVFVDPNSGEERPIDQALSPYQASAVHMQLTQPVSQQLSFNAGYTFLQESDGVLGVQSTNPLAFAAGAQTDAASLGLAWALSDGLTLSGSATLGRTRGQSADEQALSVHGDGIITSAFEAALDFEGVFGQGDRARLALVQPMHVEHGGLDLTSYEVLDRETGELGSVTRFNAVDGQARRLGLDLSYATPVFNGLGEVAGFVRAEAATADGTRGDVVNMAGGRFSLGF